MGPANRKTYSSIRNAKEWKNPYLVIRRDGVEVIPRGVPGGRQSIPIADLKNALISLPALPPLGPTVESWQSKKAVSGRMERMTSGP
jgi:hypothetical protein